MTRKGRHAARSTIPFGAVVAVLLVAAGALAAWRLLGSPTDEPGGSHGSRAGRAPSVAPPSLSPSPARGRDGPRAGVDAAGVPTPAAINSTVPGITTFRGNATRTYYGEGPLPRHPEILWRYPETGSLCHPSSAGGETHLWCGTGWTGQPNVVPGKGGRIEIRIGAYDAHYHFLDGRTGEPLRPDVLTGDLAKGSATSDPDGYPLYYAGSRDNLFRIIALDRREPRVLWTMNAETTVPNPVWNNDWDGAALVIGDYLFEGGENSWFYAIRLNRGYDEAGRVTVDPEIVRAVPGWDEQLLSQIGDTDVSIEGSVAYVDGIVYFANSGGLVQGWDVSRILRGETKMERVFRYWTGDDTDATIAIDEDGFLYVASEYQRFTARSREVGQIMKLDPSSKDPLVWGIEAQQIAFEDAGGSWSTPAIYDGTVYAATVDGRLMAIDEDSGRIRWELHLPAPLLTSPVPVDGVLVMGDCAGGLHAYDITWPRREPKELWTVDLSGCIESTPAVWHGRIWVGTRAGAIYAIGRGK